MVYDYEYFKKEILKLTSIDLNCYKERQMKRRIDTLIRNKNFSGYDKYVAAMREDRTVFDEFLSYVTINVSEFFRNPEQWTYMEQEVIPKLIRKFGRNLKIWSAACSTGEEPYSLVMLLAKFIPLSQVKVYATDLDRQCLEKAKLGLYSEKAVSNVPEELLKKHFIKIGSTYKIRDEVKQCVTFQKHDLLKDEYPRNCNLIVCRNVLIYFTEETKEELFKKFYQYLAPEGVFFIGSTEQIMNYREIGYQRMNSFFYQR